MRNLNQNNYNNKLVGSPSINYVQNDLKKLVAELWDSKILK